MTNMSCHLHANCKLGHSADSVVKYSTTISHIQKCDLLEQNRLSCGYLLLQAIDDRYAEAAARMGPDQEVIFEGEQITLDIPKEGIALESGWTITPFTYPGVSTLSHVYSLGVFVGCLNSER